MDLLDRVLGEIKERKTRVEKGLINSIPTPFKRFSRYYIGIERATYYLMTAGTKVGKTQITLFLFIINPLLYAYYNRKVDIKIFYFPLEETAERVFARIMSYLLHLFYKIDVDYKTLMSSKNEALSQDIVDLLESDKMKSILKFFEEHITFVEDEKNPTGYYNTMKRYAEANGTIHYTDLKIKDEFGEEKMVKKFSHYEPNNPDKYVISIVDHVSLLDTERGFTLKQTIDKYSEYNVILRNRYGISPIAVQQQAFNETADNVKAGLLKPSLTGASDSRYPSRDANVALGLYSPFRAKDYNYMGYDVTLLKDRLRSLEVLANRDGETGGIIALDFNGKVASFKELPLPDSSEMNEIYEQIRKERSNKAKQKVTLFMHKITKLLTKN